MEEAFRQNPRASDDYLVERNAILLGIVIGCNALVGAGAVVVHNVPDGKVVAGHPARIIKDVRELSAYENR